MKQLLIRTFLLLLFSATICDASWLIFHKPAFKGKIMDIDTNQPIEGAVVVAIYRRQEIAPGDSVNVNIDAREALTNKKGEFSIPSYTTFISPLSWSNSVNFYVFKPGYASLGPAYLEENLSGSGKYDSQIPVDWNHKLKYHIIRTGVIMLPKVTGQDRIDNYKHMSWGLQLKHKLPLVSELEEKENKLILELTRQRR